MAPALVSAHLVLVDTVAAQCAVEAVCALSPPLLVMQAAVSSKPVGLCVTTVGVGASIQRPCYVCLLS